MLNTNKNLSKILISFNELISITYSYFTILISMILISFYAFFAIEIRKVETKPKICVDLIL